MRTAIILSLSCLLSLFGFGQKQSFELELSGKYGVHAKNTQSESFQFLPIRISGSSAGLGFNYKRALGKKLYGKVGAGFNRLTVNKIDILEYPVGTRPFDPVNVGNGTIVYNVGDYYYNNLMFTAGASYEKNINKNLKFTFGGDIVYLHSIMQRYYPGTDEEGSSIKKSQNFSLALGLNANAGVLYKIKNSKFYLNPKLVMPVYQRMFADKLLMENNKYDHPQKWLGGAGFSFSVGKYF